MRSKTLWNSGWEFYCDESCGESLPAGPLSWQPVTLPHDWQIWHVQDLYRDGTGWYRKTLDWTPGRRCCLFFEGVYMDSTVFVNGHPAMEWKYGYSSFQADVTDFLTSGQNEVLVRCTLKHPNSRWYSGAGIYRDVWRLDYPESHLVTDSLYISSREGENGCWNVTVSVEAEQSAPGDSIAYTLYAADGSITASLNAEVNREAVFPVKDPQLWSISNPYCYCLRAELCRDGAVLDTLESVCGFRTVEVSPDRGLFLNHAHLVLHGVALHHDLGCLGAAFSEPAARRQLQIMKDMGANALRTTHNMPAPGLMALADEMGLLVIDEAFDMWVKSKTTYDYARFFPEWYKTDVASWVRRDRNHPSLLFWSTGNEIYDTHRDASGRETSRKLLEEVIRNDPGKNGLTTFGSNYMAWENTQNCAPDFDVVGYNYGESLYDAHHQAHPDWVIYGSETASIVQSRGIYHFLLSQPVLVDDDLQCSSLGNSRTSWGAKSHQDCIASDERYPYCLGQFLWSGIDYIGEPTPYHTKNSYFGLVDTAGFPKDAYYAYQAGWHSWREKRVLHLLPYWDFNPGQKIDVCILSNLPEVELEVNGISQGRKRLAGGSDNQAHWQVTYAPGEIRAIGYDDNGCIVMETREHSFGDGTRLAIQADRTQVNNSGRDLVFCTVTVLDAQGNPVRNANNRVAVEVTGSLKLAGLDNGNSADYDEYKTNSRRLFSGMLLAVAAGSGEAGRGTIRVSSPGLESASVTVDVLPASECFPVLPEITPDAASEEIPVRKLELQAETTILTADCRETIVHVQRYPRNAQAEPLQWRVTDVQGISVGNAVLEPIDECTMRVVAAGDGKVRIRCMSGYILSDLEMEIQGIGDLYLNPYAYVSAALYNRSFGDIGNGNERGIATSDMAMSWVAYDRLDFGSGTDTLTIDVFELSSMPAPIRFWKGIPYAPGSRMIGERVYDKPSIWNVYQEDTYQLDECLTGQDVLGIELHSKVHIKGFTFRERNRTWDRIPALAYSTVYGDTFTLTEQAVEAIGNNVALTFRNLDFGTQGTDSLVIRGKSKLDNNTVHLRFESDSDSQRRVVEFSGAETWTERRFRFDPIYGRQDVTFLFLPGCDFDFSDFQFLPIE